MFRLALRPPIFLLVVVATIGALGTHLIVPSLPSIDRHFSSDYGSAQLIVSAFLISFGAGQLFVGSFADYLGRRTVLLGGVALFALASFACAFAPNVEVLVALRVAQGATGCVGLVVARAMIRDLYDAARVPSMLGYLATGVSIAPMVAPVTGGMIFERYGWRGVFLSLGLFGIVLFLAAFFTIPSRARGQHEALRPSSVLRDLRALIHHRDFLLYTAIIGLNTAVFYSFIVAGPYISTYDLAMSPIEYGSWFTLVAVGYAAGNFLSASAVQVIGARWLIFGGSSFAALAISGPLPFLLSDNRSAAAMFVSVALFTFASGFIMPNCMASVLSAMPARTGSASGLMGFLQFAVAAFFSTLTGMIIKATSNSIAVFLFLDAIAVLMAVASAGALTRPTMGGEA